MPVSSEKKRIMNEAAIECIIADARPWGDFQRPGMSKFLSIALPGYDGPSIRTVQRQLSKLYLEKYHDFKNELADVANVSITLDLWKSSRSHYYLCITVHWIDSSFYVHGKVLSFRKFKGRHVKRILVQYNLINKIIATTTDNGSNVKAATGHKRIFGSRIHCLAHALNLTVHKGLCLWPKNGPAIGKSGDLNTQDRY